MRAAAVAVILAALPHDAAAQTAQERTAAALRTIERLDRGPQGLNAVIAADPSAMAQARDR